MKLLDELRRRNVLRAAIAYVVTAWVIVESSSLLLDIFKAPDWVAQTIVVMLVAGFPVAVVFAWMFEITPDGIKPDHEVSRETGASTASSRYLVMVTIVMAMIAVGLFAVDRFLIDSEIPMERDDGPPFVAVMPFEVIGAGDAASLADGLHHDLLTRMSKLHAFKTISRTSMLEYRETAKNVRKIGEELGVAYVLEGAVQLSGERVRINAQLIDATADEHLWADTYDRELTASDLFTIQSALAIDIAEQLELALSAEDRQRAVEIPTRNTDAYTAYLRALALLDDPALGQDRASRAHAEIRRAVSLDPEFAAAWVQLIRHSAFRGVWDDYESMFADSSAALETVHQIAPDSYEAGIAKVYFVYYVLSDYENVLPAIADLEERGALSADALYMRGKALRRAGRLEDAYRAYLDAARLNPRSMNVLDDILMTAIMRGDCEHARVHATAALALAPDYVHGRVAAANYELQCTGDGKKAAELVRDFVDTDDSALWAARGAAAIEGDWERMLELFERGERSENWWGDPVVDQLIVVFILKRLGRDAAARQMLVHIGSILDSNAPGESDIQQFEYATLRARYHSFRGDAEDAHHWLNEINRYYLASRDLDPISRAQLLQGLLFTYSEIGAYDEAIEVLGRLLAGPSFITFRFVDSHVAFERLREQPGYAELRRKYGS